MPVTKVNINLSVLENLELPNFNISNDTTTLINELPEKANQYTHNLYGNFVIVGLFLYLFYKLTDDGINGDFRYSKIRGFGIATGICGVISGVMNLIGYYNQLYSVVACLVLCSISLAWVLKEEN